jgi:hypothetical protein
LSFHAGSNCRRIGAFSSLLSMVPLTKRDLIV